MAPWDAWHPELHRGEVLIPRIPVFALTLGLALTVASQVQAQAQVAEFNLRIDAADRQVLHVEAKIPVDDRWLTIGYPACHRPCLKL